MIKPFKMRVLRALKREKISQILIQINNTVTKGEEIGADFRVPMESLGAFLGNHIQRVDLAYKSEFSQEGRFFDWWGLGFDTQEVGNFTAMSPLSTSKVPRQIFMTGPKSSTSIG